MPNLRRNFTNGKMNKDVDERLLQDGEYRHAENIMILDSEGSDVGAVQNSFATLKLTNIDLGQNCICLGGYADEATQKLYWLIKSDLGCYLLEYDLKNSTVSKILEDTRVGVARVFDLKETNFVTAINKIISGDPDNDLLIINDDNMQPLCINIARAKTYGPNGFEKEDIFLIKKPPRFALKTFPLYVQNLGNAIEDKFLSFSYRYKYLDGEYSALSSYSNYCFYPEEFKLDYEMMCNLGMINRYNAIRLILNTGDKRVTDIQVIVKGSNSNNLYVIETFNKINEGWKHDEARSLVFSNNKIYTVLPENESYRSFDNLPLKAKAQTVIGNRIVMGNFLEGYDLFDKNNVKIKLDYNISVVSLNLRGAELPYEINNNSLRVDLSGLELKEGNELSFNLVLDNSQSTPIRYSASYSFILTKDYANANQLAQDPDFALFFTDYITAIFLRDYTVKHAANLTLASNTTFLITLNSTNKFNIISPQLVYNTSGGTETINWNFINRTSVMYRKEGVSSSVKTNKSYEIGFIYMDEFNRATTVLTQLRNTVWVNHNLAIFKNKIKISLTHRPPKFADRYKIVVKQPALKYKTIYASFFYKDGLYVWIRLQGSNFDKVKAGDTLIIKADVSGFVPTLTKVSVLELGSKDKSFIDGNLDGNGTQIDELPGIYMRIKPPGNTNFNYDPDGFRVYTDQNDSQGDSFSIFMGPFSKTINGVETDIPIKQGTRIDIELSNNMTGENDVKFNKTYYSSTDYNNFKDWYDTEVNGNLGPFNSPLNGLYRGPDISKPSSQGLWLRIKNVLNGNGEDWGLWSTGHSSYLNGTVKISATNGILIFETEEKNELAEDIYYETEQTFEIIEGEHQGNIQNQTNNLPAEIELDFFNCFSMGNGAESYVIKDEFNKPFLNIDLRPSIATIEKYKAVRRYADLTYSDAYIESSNINGLNVFNKGTLNFKELDKQFGSIQKLHSRDNDILVLKENKASKVMFEKGLLYNADGSSNVTASGNVLGPELTYVGDNGIGKNPESFAENNYQIYYANTKQGNVVRLSIDGVTDIVNGMTDWFRDLFRLQPNAKKLGGYDPYSKQYVLSVGEEPEKILVLNCGNHIIKNEQLGPFTYQFKLNNLSGDVVLNYNITAGFATIEALFNGVNHVVSNVTSLGTVTFNRSSLMEDIVTVVITPVTEKISYEISNLCPLGSQAKIISIVLNDKKEIGKNITNRFKWGNSLIYDTDDLFDDYPVSKFLEETGVEGNGKFPANNSVITIDSYKDNFSSGEFLLQECNRLGYLITDTAYTQADINTILGLATFLDITKSGAQGYYSINSGSFLYNKINPDDKLYLIYDYTNRKPIVNDDTIVAAFGASTIVDVLSNDNATNATITIVTQPAHGTAIVNQDNTITYTSNIEDTAATVDTFTYRVSNGSCVSDIATVTLNIFKDVIVFDADYMVLTYNFTDGRDLDTRTRIVTPNIGQNSVAQCLGYGCSYAFPTNGSVATQIPVDAIIDHAGDNTGIGLESVFIDITKIKANYPGQDTIVVECRAFWWGTIGVNDVNLIASFYKGGAMLKNTPLTNPMSFNYTNPTAADSLVFNTSGKPIQGPIISNPSFAGYRLATFTYTISTGIGTFDLNDTTTPAPN
jgi:hypothetical protein